MPDRTRPSTRAERRAQIVAATVELVAEEGVAACTFARIAARSGLSSTRLISYHFDDKDELLRATVAHLLGVVGAAADPVASADPADALAAYIRTAVDLNRTHGAEMRALMRLFLDFRPADGGRVYTAGDDVSALSRVEEILVAGQRDGRFRDFDPWVLATLVQRSVDGLPFLLEARPDLDLTAYADEVVEAVRRATEA